MKREVYEFISKQSNDQIVQRRTCKASGKEFAIFQSDMDFFDKISPVFGGKKIQIPLPTLCPEERQRRRLSRRNESKLYRGICNATGKSIVSSYSPDKKYKIYDQKVRWSDQRNPLDYGQEIDFTKPFFQQFQELMLKVPRINLMNTDSENSEYTNYSGHNKNCYLIFSNSHGNNENCMYGTLLSKSYNCAEAIHIKECSLCYNVNDCVSCTNVRFSSNCMNCSYGAFLDHCKNCTNCIGCIGLNDASYRIFNKQYTKKEYEILVKKMNLTTRSGINACMKEYDIFKNTLPFRACEIENSTNCTGNYIKDSTNCQICYDTTDTENCKYLHYSVGQDKNISDCGYLVNSALSYEVMSLVDGYHDLFCQVVWRNTADLLYCDNCFSIKNCFGCIGLRNNKEYCILNKQYTKAEYEKLVPKLIEHMQTTGERGEFFPTETSPFCYNETIAQEYFPMEKAEALKRNYKRSDAEYTINIPQGMPTIKAEELPDDILDVTDNILNKIIICSKSGRPFRIIKMELDLYRKIGIPIPRYHPDVRRMERFKYRAKRELYVRTCDKTGETIMSVYPADAPFKVYSIEAYNKEIYG